MKNFFGKQNGFREIGRDDAKHIFKFILLEHLAAIDAKVDMNIKCYFEKNKLGHRIIKVELLNTNMPIDYYRSVLVETAVNFNETLFDISEKIISYLGKVGDIVYDGATLSSNHINREVITPEFYHFTYDFDGDSLLEILKRIFPSSEYKIMPSLFYGYVSKFDEIVDSLPFTPSNIISIYKKKKRPTSTNDNNLLNELIIIRVDTKKGVISTWNLRNEDFSKEISTLRKNFTNELKKSLLKNRFI